MSDFGRPLFFNVGEMRARAGRVHPVVLGIVTELLDYGSGGPFVWDTAVITRLFDGVSADALRRMESDLKLFFVELPDGRWTPSHEVFSAVDGTRGNAS